MSQIPIIQYVKSYSKIDGFQKEHTITYTAENSPKGIVLSLTECKDNSSKTEKCIAQISPQTACNALLFLSENSFNLCNWLDVLEDFGISVIK